MTEEECRAEVAKITFNPEEQEFIDFVLEAGFIRYSDRLKIIKKYVVLRSKIGV